MECGTHSPWVSRLLQGMGHEVLVANARKIRAITDSESKNDRNDAEKLARFAAYDLRLLSPIQHRSPERQRDLNLLQARDTLVTGTNHAGECDARVGEERRATTAQVFDGIVCQDRADNDSRRHGASAHAVDRASSEFDGADPEDGQTDRSTGETISRSREVTERARRGTGDCGGVRVDAGLTGDGGKEPGGGRLPGITAAAKPIRRVRSAAIGSAKPATDYLRRLLVQAAQYVLGRFGPDSELRRWGLKLAASGGKRGKKRAVIAVARKLAVLLHHLWRSGEYYRPFPNAQVFTP